MKIIIHRGTHQIGGIATEIRTDNTRILIDMGEELSLDPDFTPAPLHIAGVTDDATSCDSVLFTHYHGDHIGQMSRIRDDIPLYAGVLCKEIMFLSDRSGSAAIKKRISSICTFDGGSSFRIGDITITPYSIDHTACDSYMFLIEADGKRILYTGDFRLHGFRGKGMMKILDKLIAHVDVVVTEGTTISRANKQAVQELELQKRLKSYIEEYPYVFVLCASTNIDRVFACAHSVPWGKYFICDETQLQLMKTVEKKWSKYSKFYQIPKATTYGDNRLDGFKKLGFVMMVRDNQRFRSIIRQFDKKKSIMLYSMWDGYRTKPNSTLPEFLALAGTWDTLHTSGHASAADIRKVIDRVNPKAVIPIHTDAPEIMKTIANNRKVIVLADGEEYLV